MKAANASKGAATRELIVKRALDICHERGLDALTIGTLADAAGMSKSGVFAHFGSREDLQLAVLDAAASEFTEDVFAPAIRAPRGLPRLHRLIESWTQRTLRLGARRGCPIAAAAFEFDDRPGPVRDHIMAYLAHLRREIARAVRMAVDAGQIRADVEPEQIAFEVHGLMLGFHFEVKLDGVERAAARMATAAERLIAAISVKP
jgi:AcrR family transcriptional regulator